MLIQDLTAGTPARTAIRRNHLRDERSVIRELLPQARLPAAQTQRVSERARRLAARARERMKHGGGIEALLHEYDLSSEEGVLLMCLAEALLRIPDPETQERLIADKLSKGHWDEHLGRSHSLMVNASTWGLLLSGRLVGAGGEQERDIEASLQRLLARTGEKVVRLALYRAVDLLARYFVMGTRIEQALARSATETAARFSYDCLGEAARTRGDVERYFAAYRHAIQMLAAREDRVRDPVAGPGISVKLSALHPRFEYGQHRRVMNELLPRLRQLALAARDAGIGLTLDAEETERLELTLDLFEALYTDDALGGWAGLGLAVQAYQKRAWPVLHWLGELAAGGRRPIVVRLVKGAYWDSEIKRAQVLGLDGYPVFTRKRATDVSYLACARYLLDHLDLFCPQFATHNAHTVAYILEALEDDASGRVEFQRLHGMGEALYEALAEEGVSVPCRVYAPIGSHEELLPYLVRRLLENGANTSFINRLAREEIPLAQLVEDPVALTEGSGGAPHPRIPLPRDLYDGERLNARGLDLADPETVRALDQALEQALTGEWVARPRIAGEAMDGETRPVIDPADQRRVAGRVTDTRPADLGRAWDSAAGAFEDWSRSPAGDRAGILERAAELLEARHAELMARIVREGGRTLADALAEVREAVDACRYYAARARREFETAAALPGPTGEANSLGLAGRGVFVCISPWNFPLAIFTGQIAAALAAGNTVLAKPARHTPLSAALAVELLHEAGIPAEVLHFVPGSGADLGKALLADRRLGGIAFTGSTETAWILQQRLARRRGPIVPLIAETGGLNAMIVDSSALPEQVVSDVLASAFNSAGQRCSSLRLLFLQNETADRVLELLAGAMEELNMGDPLRLSTDVGPVIDREARQVLEDHARHMERAGRLHYRCRPGDAAGHGCFFPPQVFEIPSPTLLEKEVFGPVLHVVRYRAADLDRVIDAVNRTGYGLTLGVHSRIQSTWERVQQRARVGNLYVNRNMIGAVIGVQPFGGEGLSGTGPKAGGPRYLHRFATERTVSINTAAIGGNADLLSADEDE